MGKVLDHLVSELDDEIQKFLGRGVGSMGFDTADFPKDKTALRDGWLQSDHPIWWWVGYYLEAPNHHAPHRRPWQGHWEEIVEIGYGLALIYVGKQTPNTDPGTKYDRIDPSPGQAAQQGAADGREAVNNLSVGPILNGNVVPEHLPEQAVCFLDVETVPHDEEQLYIEYMRAWFKEVADGNYTPGLYFNFSNRASFVPAANQASTDARQATPAPLWVAHWPMQAKAGDLPSKSGVQEAAVWQYNANQPFVNKKIDAVDFNIALSKDPSGVRSLADL